MKKKGIVIIVLLFTVLIGGATVLYGTLAEKYSPDRMTEADSTEMTAEQQEQSEETRGEKAPVFTVYDINGNEVMLSDFYGKPVILNFWASWCGGCIAEKPVYQSMYEKYGEDIHFVVVNLTDGQRETVEKAKKFIDDNSYTFPVYYDTDMDAAEKYAVYSIPITYFIDSEGYAVAYASGPVTEDVMMQGIDYIYRQ